MSARGPVLVVLAAGASERLGRCKALVALRETAPATPLALLLAAGRALEDLPLAPPLIVTGADHDLILPAVPPGVEVALNPRWSEGRAGSILAARAARPGHDLCLAPVDVPLVPAAIFRALGQAWRDAGAPPRGWLSPETRDLRGGHPVVVGRELLAQWAPPSLDEPLRGLRARAMPSFVVRVDSAAIHDDLDTPADLERLRRALR
jgi:CTP:molybdopterin cytidylyltransferase MocA